MEITEGQLKELCDIASAIDDENRIDDAVVNECDRKEIEASENTLPIYVAIALFLKEQAAKHKTEEQNIVVGLMHNDLFVWDYDGGRAMSLQWQTKNVIHEPLNGR